MAVFDTFCSKADQHELSLDIHTFASSSVSKSVILEIAAIKSSYFLNSFLAFYMEIQLYLSAYYFVPILKLMKSSVK